MPVGDAATWAVDRCAPPTVISPASTVAIVARVEKVIGGKFVISIAVEANDREASGARSETTAWSGGTRASRPLLVNSWLGRARGYSLEYAQPRSTVATPNASRTLERASVVMSRHDVMVVTTPPESACCLFAHGSPLRQLAVLELPGALRSARRSPRA